MDYYNDIAKGYNALHEEEQRAKLEIIKSTLWELGVSLNSKSKLLDVGCGTAFSREYFDCNFTGVDPANELLNVGKKEGITLICAGAENLPFENKTFDIVISVTAIHNFTDIERGILEMKRVGKKDFVFSILRKNNRMDEINEIINSNFKIKRVIEQRHDKIFFCVN